MSFFSRKQKINLEDFCRDFYEKNILNPVIGGVDLGAVYYDTVRTSLVEPDHSLSSITSQKFAAEIVPLRFELFALAWLHKFGLNPAIPQSVFTNSYLQEKGRGDIWEDAKDYNQAIARSSTFGREREKAADRLHVARANKTKFELYKKYCHEGHDGECVARVLNRMFAEGPWKSNITAGLLACALCLRLGLDVNSQPNTEAQSRLIAVIRGLYDGAYQFLRA